VGGVFSSLASTAGEAAERSLTGLTDKMADSTLGRGILSLAGNKEWELELTPEGKAIKGQLAEYQRLRTTSLNASNKETKAIMDWHQSSDQVRNALPLKTSTLGQIHNYAQQVGHPIANITSAIIVRNPSANAGLTLNELAIKNLSQARLAAMSGSVGDKMQNIAPLIASLLEHSDPRIQMNGRRVADIVSNELKDTRIVKAPGGIQSTQSTSKVVMNRSFAVVNKFRALTGDKSIPSLNTDATYNPVSAPERAASDILRMVQIPFVAIPHIGQYFHLGASAPLQAVGKALLRMDQVSMERTIDASSILANTEWDVIHSDILARSGKVAKYTNSPTAASIISKTIHQPGFNYFRLKQLAAAGAVGFHSAQFWATNAMRGDKRALAELTEMGIDFRDVQAQGGRLNEEQLQKGVYHFVNNRFFVNKTIDQSILGNSNFFMRSAFMYHSFISSETAYLRREILKQLKVGDVKGISQFVGVLGVVFPFVAPMLKSAELLARTGSLQQAQVSMQKDYQGLTHPDSFGDFATTYMDMIAHIGAMGAAYNYTQAIKSSRLANAVVGPMIGMWLTDIEDSVNALRGKSAKPLGRDATQMIPVIGKPLSHELFPTVAESKSSRIRGTSRRRERRVN
jgi:hypothetical protein